MSKSLCLQARSKPREQKKAQGAFLPQRAIRCSNHSDKGNILVVLTSDGILVKCRDRDCKRWTKISINIPGVKLNLSEAGITQKLLPENYHLTLEPAASVVL